MGWFFSRKPPHPLDAAELRPLEARILAGETRSVQADVQKARTSRGDVPAVRYLECLLYHEASGAAPKDLLAHLKPAIEPGDGVRFPEARLLEARLHGARGRFDEALTALNLLAKEKLSAPLAERVRALAAEIGRQRGPEGLRAVVAEAEALASDLARQDLVIRWRASDLARLDSLLDEPSPLDRDQSRRYASLAGEIACRAGRGSWRLALRPEDRAVSLGASEWSPAQALRERTSGAVPLYAAFHTAAATRRQAVDGMPGLEVVVEPGVNPAVVADHAARALHGLGVTALAVFRERPTPEGPVTLPISFVDKGGVLRAVYIETRPWEPERLGELTRWIGRLRLSAAREAAVALLAAHPPPPAVAELLGTRPGSIPGSLSASAADARAASRAATPRSLDEPKMRWLDQRAEMMERLVRAALGAGEPNEIEVVRKVQQTVLSTLTGEPGDLAPKQWHALYGYGALYGRVLARVFGGRWSALGDDKPPGEWEMVLPWGRVVQPIGQVLALSHSRGEAGDLVAHFLEVKSANDAAGRG